jgi:hypothetical protein
MRYSLRSWVSVFLANKAAPFVEREGLYRRALKFLPFSYKIWIEYLTEYCDFAMGKPIASSHYQKLNALFEECLGHLPRMPRIWLMYC